MGLRIKSFTQILNSMANWIYSSQSNITNFHVGSVIRTLLESVSIEIESLYLQVRKVLDYSIENSIYHSFEFQKLPATPASGEITIVFRNPLQQKIFIEKGTKFCTNPVDGEPLYYSTTESIFVGAGNTYAKINVQCDTVGIVGNVPAYSINRMVTPIVPVLQVYNEKSLTLGAEEESKEERQKRFTQYISTLSKGTLDAILYGCLQTSGVSGAYAEEHIGWVSLYVHDSNGELTQELKDNIQQELLNFRSAGVQVVISPVVRVPIDLQLKVTLSNSSYDENIYHQLILTSVTNFLNQFKVAKPLIRAELVRYLMSIDRNAVSNVELGLTEDIITQGYELIRAGNIQVTFSEGV